MTERSVTMKSAKKPTHISQKDWDSVDFPRLTDEQLARMRPAREVFPDIDQFPKPRSRGSQKTLTKEQTTIRLDREILAHFRRGGRGWQTRMNQALRHLVERQKKRAKS
jgi:uncharacterized protein (DUF4415 family)